MKKLIALLLVLAMLLVSVCAVAESEATEEAAAEETEEAVEVVEGEEEVTDDIDAEAVEAELEAEKELADAEMTVGATENALDNGRKIDTTIDLATYTEDLADLNGLTVKLSAQNNGVNSFSYDVDQNGENLYNGTISYADNKLYVQMAALGEETYVIDMNQIASMVEEALGFSTAEGEETENALDLNNIPVQALATTDWSSLDLTPMVPAIMALNSCVTLSDITDQNLGTESAEEEIEGEATETEEAADDTEAVDETVAEVETEDGIEDNTDTGVAMLMNIVISRDDMSILINAIAATIEANAELLAPYGITADEFTETANAVADTFAEAIAGTVGLDADGNAVYMSVDYSLTDVGSFRVQGYKTVEEEGTSYKASVLMSGDEANEYITIFSGEVDIAVNTVYVRFLQGDEADLAAGAQLSVILPYGEITDYEVDFDTVDITEGVTTYPLSVSAKGNYVVNDPDFTFDGTVTVSTDDAQNKVAEATINVATAAADEIDLSGAIDITDLGAEENTDLVGDDPIGEITEQQDATVSE